MGWKKKTLYLRAHAESWKKSTANQMLTLPLIYGPQSNRSYRVCVWGGVLWIRTDLPS